MRILSLFIILATVISCSHFQNARNPSGTNSSKPRHLVITVHGLSGNAQTFGLFGEVTKSYLEQLDSRYEVKAVNFIYPTGKDEKKSAYDFAMGPKGITNFINDQFKDRPFSPQDKISFVCHSQGGLVTYMWFFNTVLSRTEGYNYLPQIDSIITLGTPFWGSKVASILTDENNLDLIWLIKALAPKDSPITRREISDLAFASDTVNNFRKMAVTVDNIPTLAAEIEKLPVRMVNIVGLLPKDPKDLYSDDGEALASKLTKRAISFLYDLYTLDSKQYTKDKTKNQVVESDVAVPVPSARWNFIYSKPKPITEDMIIESKDYKGFTHLVGRSKFLFTESAHMPFDIASTRSMAYVGKNCMQPETCDHQTYRYIIKQLANCRTSSNDSDVNCDPNAYAQIIEKMKSVNAEEHERFYNLQKGLKSFAVQINMRLKPGQLNQFPDKYFFKRQKLGPNGQGSFERVGLDEYSLKDKVINLMRDRKTGKSFASNTPGSPEIVFGDRWENHAIDIVSKQATADDNYDYLRVNITGRIEDPNRSIEKQYTVPMEINLPGLPSVKMNILVQPSYSTYTDLDYTQAQ